MQPANVQVERSSEAGRGVARDEGAAGPGAADHRPDIPLHVVERVLRAPSVRAERLAGARRRLAAGQTPTDDALAERMVARLVWDRLR
jgi:hypothetical protein